MLLNLYYILYVLTSLNCTVPASPSSETEVYAASGWMKSWHKAISSLLNIAPILVCSYCFCWSEIENFDVVFIVFEKVSKPFT